MRDESGEEGARKLKKWHGLLARSRGSFELHCSKATKPWSGESGEEGGTERRMSDGLLSCSRGIYMTLFEGYETVE